MKMIVGAGFALALLPLNHVAAAASAPDLDAIVKAVMEDQYGKQYDARHACWSFAYTTEQGDDLTYCMQPGKPQVVETAKGRKLFIYAANANEIRDDKRYTYGHNEPGLMGAFEIALDVKGGWTYDALEQAMEFGSAGYCGCNQADFVKLSNRGDYGWLFVSGGTWQGTVVADYSIVLPHKGGFADVSRVPQIHEGAQDVKYELKIVDDASADGLFPLLVTRTRGGAMVAEIPVRFDTKVFEYRLPEGK
jgi:hypothetical protein